MSGKMGPETRLLNKMRDTAKKHYGPRFVVVKYHGSAMGEAGVSDTLCSLDGLFVAIEVKSPEASSHKRKTLEASIDHALRHGPTVKQRAFMARVLATGACGGFAATVEQYMDILEHAADMAAGDVPRPCWGHNMDGPD